MNELVSIIMPSYNTAKFISETIQSVLEQTYTNWELIIVDDCSTDNTDEVVSLFLSDARIHYLKNEKNSGAALSRNRALREAKGRWIAFLDSDDLWLPEKLEKQIKFMEDNGYAFSYTDYRVIDGNGDGGDVRTGPHKVDKKRMYRYCYVATLTVMYDQNIAGLIQIADLKKNNDYAMWLKVIEKTDGYRLAEVLASYRKRENSISSGNKLKLIKYHYIMFRGSEDLGVIKSMLFTLRNLFFGFLKKLRYH